MSVSPRSPLWGQLLAVVALVVTSPVLGLGAVVVKLSSRGPVLYRAPRAGLDNRQFMMLKLRTMRDGGAGPGGGLGGRISGGHDPRVYPAGRLLRRLKIDELPQLANIAHGDMAFFGPRPEDPVIVSEHYTPFLASVLAARPGLTSPGSLCYFADEQSLPDDPALALRAYVEERLPLKVALDLVYLRHRSWRYDLELVVRTAASISGLRAPFAARRAWELDESHRLLETAGAHELDEVGR